MTIEVELTGSWKHDNPTGDTASAAGSGVCELTNRSNLGICEVILKETGAKRVSF